ncbi:MAG: hypothetical protein MJ181_10330 [Treponema sp.]|nr:hypothetical protein [Treponema sp.]
MKIYNKLFILGAMLLSVNAFSCKNGFLPNSIGEEITPTKNPEKTIECPTNVKATNGGKQKIILSWDSVQKAVKYYIYAANTPFESFVKIGETTDLNYTYKLMPGLTRCLKVTAVTYQGVESGDSIIVTGSSLACPAISSITTDTDDNGSVTTVYWYMENADQYQENLRYEIYCYNGTSQIAFGQLDGSLTEQMNYTFKNLPQNSSFDFQVIAYLNSEQNDTESSDLMNALTAAKQTPDAVSDLKATKATSLDSITLTFSLPEPSYVKTGVTAGNETFTQYPLFFKLFRRVAGTENWTVVTDHLYCDGSLAGPSEEGTPIVIEQTDDAVTKLQKQEKINAWFDQTYIAGTEISYTDTSLDSKTEYEYKLQSYIDNYKNALISSDKISVSGVVSGFTAAIPSVTAVWNGYEYSDPETEDFKLSASISFNMSWDNFGEEANYKYVLKTTRVTVPENEEDESNTIITYETFDSIESLNESTKSFSLSKTKIDEETQDETLEEDYTQEGYYNYDIFIVEKTAEVSETDDPAEYIAFTSAPGTYLVTPVLTLPEISGFEIKDGFKDKVEITWQKQEHVTYSLERYKIDKDNIKVGTVDPVIFTDLTPDETTALVQDPADSGIRYVYTLTAVSGKYKVPSLPLTAECLGTPVPVFDTETAKHDSITITWNKVLKADSYEIDFTNGNTSFEGFPVSSDDLENLPEGITITENGALLTCTLDKPAGYDDATVSGKTWNASVTAKNNSTSDTTETNTAVFTMGPAAVTELAASVAESNSSINVSWKPVPGAKGYAIRRARCEVEAPYKEVSVDVYMISAEGGAVSANSTSIDAASIVITDTKITLTDHYKEIQAITPSVWDKNQDMLAWGFPYKYTVMPLETLEEEIETEADSSEVVLGDITYLNFNANEISKIGSCIGYGHKVTATKSEDPRFVTITWTKPYMGSKTLEPVLWYSPSGQNQWSKNGTKTNSDGVFKPELLGDERTRAFDFAVSYTSEPHNTYYEELSKLEDGAVEPENKGYAFAISLEASNIKDSENNPTLKERFDWTIWDYSERAVGPDVDTYLFQMFNNDFCTSPDDWKTIAEIDKDGNIALANLSAYKISADEFTNRIEIYPSEKFVSGDKTYDWYEGLLKVLRDYRHYARLETTRTVNINGEETTIHASYSDDEVFNYRNITDTEFARAGLLNMAYGYFMQNGGETDYSNIAGSIYIDNGSTEKGIYTGSFEHSGGSYVAGGILIGKYSHTQLASKYCPAMLTVSGDNISFLEISNAQQTFYTKGAGEGFFCYEKPFDILINCKNAPNTDISKIFSGTITPALGWTEKTTLGLFTTLDKQEMSISVTRNGNTTTVMKPSTDNTEIHFYFPIQINDNKTWYLNDQNYGWW